ncbi:SgcJ/EcaC family oxidoreductase [Occultella gossypii]|uniref:SgcJ/EcaC family oxidoreductase n=1 Tax=Occultella gossypii TaxID=2800820 RepID=A0ABS7SDV1_9MICO|nr:SgcJ/EcaC family oxidoreductase [Occultella gossypii]MBZ2198427.1 SgcJ/EcaC family oxidoreductase [Occultella gossypii]
MTTDDIQIQNLFDGMLAAWTRGDAPGYGACFTEDSDYVSYDGTRAEGRQPMVDAHHKLFRGVLAGSALVGEIESIRYVGNEVAVVHATGSVLMPWRSSLPKRRLSRQTLVAVHGDNGWRIAALHNGRVRPITVPQPDSFPSKASRTMSRIARAVGIGRATASG